MDIKYAIKTNSKFKYFKCKDGVYILSYQGSGGNVVIPKYIGFKLVVGICKSAFEECNSLISIKIPNSVKRIDAFAFACCRNLKSVKLGKHSRLERIEKYAFYGCNSLTDIKIPNDVWMIEEWALEFNGPIPNDDHPDNGMSMFEIERLNAANRIEWYDKNFF